MICIERFTFLCSILTLTLVLTTQTASAQTNKRTSSQRAPSRTSATERVDSRARVLNRSTALALVKASGESPFDVDGCRKRWAIKLNLDERWFGLQATGDDLSSRPLDFSRHSKGDYMDAKLFARLEKVGILKQQSIENLPAGRSAIGQPSVFVRYVVVPRADVQAGDGGIAYIFGSRCGATKVTGIAQMGITASVETVTPVIPTEFGLQVFYIFHSFLQDEGIDETRLDRVDYDGYKNKCRDFLIAERNISHYTEIRRTFHLVRYDDGWRVDRRF